MNVSTGAKNKYTYIALSYTCIVIADIHSSRVIYRPAPNRLQ